MCKYIFNVCNKNSEECITLTYFNLFAANPERFELNIYSYIEIYFSTWKYKFDKYIRLNKDSLEDCTGFLS